MCAAEAQLHTTYVNSKSATNEADCETKVEANRLFLWATRVSHEIVVLCSTNNLLDTTTHVGCRIGISSENIRLYVSTFGGVANKSARYLVSYGQVQN